MIGIWILSIWIILGLLNMWILDSEINEGAKDVSGVYEPNFFKRYSYIILMVFSPYYFVLGVYEKIYLFITIQTVKKIMYKSWKKQGKNPREEWKKLDQKVKKQIEDEKKDGQ